MNLKKHGYMIECFCTSIICIYIEKEKKTCPSNMLFRLDPCACMVPSLCMAKPELHSFGS